MATQPDPLARFRQYSLWLAVLAAAANTLILVFTSPAPMAWRLAGVGSIAALIVWWVLGYRARVYPLSGLLAEAVPLWIVGVATAGLMRGLALFFAAHQLAGLYGRRRSLAWVFAALGVARVAVYGFSEGPSSILSIPALGSVVILTYVGVSMYLVADAMQKQADSDAAVRASDERFRIVQSVTTDVIYDWAVVGDRVEWTGNLDVFGYTRDAPTSFSWWMQRVHDDDRARVVAALLAHQEATTAKPLCYRLRRANGTYAQIATTVAVQRDSAGQPIRVVGALRDMWTT